MQRTLLGGKIRRATASRVDLMRGAGMIEGEQVYVVDINGAAAHLISPRDRGCVVHVGSDYRIVAPGHDPAEPVPGAADQTAGA